MSRRHTEEKQNRRVRNPAAAAENNSQTSALAELWTAKRVPLTKGKDNMKSAICIYGCKILIHYLRVIVSWLCELVGVEIVPSGCRAIPAGHFNFDPEMVEVFGGSKAHDAVNKAIVYQKVVGWIQHNEKHGRNQRDGLTWSYNTYPAWAADIRIFHAKTIQKHIRDFEAMGLLCSRQFDKREGNRQKYYGAPVRPSDGLSQMLLWSESKTPMGGALDSVPSIQNPTMNNLAMDKRQSTPRPARAPKPLTGGGVAQFPIPSEDREIPEKKPSTVELRETLDVDHEDSRPVAIEGKVTEADASQTSPGSAPTPSIPSEVVAFWPTVTADAALADLVQACGEAQTLAVIRYVKTQRCDNPPGLARRLLEQGFLPPGFPPAAYPDDDATPLPDYDPDLDTESDATDEDISQPVSQPDPTAQKVWSAAYSQLEVQLDRASFDTWLRGATLAGVEGQTYVVAVANKYSADNLQHRAYRDIQRVVSDVAGAPVELRFEVRKAGVV